MKHHALTRLICLLLLSFILLCVSVLATTAAPGSEGDPLVTLSYLRETFLPELLGSVDERISARNEALGEQLSARMESDKLTLKEKYGTPQETEGESADTVDSFVVVTMTDGQVLWGEIGCEVMLRVGSAAVVSPSSPGLIDTTDAATLDSGKALVKNHLYMMTISDRGVKATAATTKVLVRGTYAVK